ncbi:MAG: hypothetical protein ACI9Y7_001922 [Dokdonia sp.]|jgi:hypothetical protein
MFTVKLIINFTMMLKNILKLEGVQELNKNQQKYIQGAINIGVGSCEQQGLHSSLGSCNTWCDTPDFVCLQDSVSCCYSCVINVDTEMK